MYAISQYKKNIFFCRLLDAEMDQPKRKYVCSKCDKFLTVEFEKTRLDMFNSRQNQLF